MRSGTRSAGIRYLVASLQASPDQLVHHGLGAFPILVEGLKRSALRPDSAPGAQQGTPAPEAWLPDQAVEAKAVLGRIDAHEASVSLELGDRLDGAAVNGRLTRQPQAMCAQRASAS